MRDELEGAPRWWVCIFIVATAAAAAFLAAQGMIVVFN